MRKTIDRLIEFIDYAGLSARQFDLSIGASNGYTLRMKKNRASIGSDVLENIFRVYPQLNIVWLLTGEGQMLKSAHAEPELDYEKLSPTQKKTIEDLVEQKVRQVQETELKELIRKISQEIENQKRSS